MDVLRSKFSTRHAALRTLLLGLTGASVAAALATPAAAQQSPATRAAALLPPIPALPSVARGAIGDAPVSPFENTPVVRSSRKPAADVVASSGPTWLSGVDPNVLPAGGTTQVKYPSRPPARITPAPAPAPGYLTAGSIVPTPPRPLVVPPPRPTTAAPPPAPAAKGNASPFANGMPPDPRPVADPNAPLQATAANGSPVLAGPPAWRWYGYGSVTPGANAFAPTGEYPRASANWFTVTKATPGAFPVPVANPRYLAAGGDPPAYVALGPTRPAFVEPRANDAFTGAPVNAATPATPPMPRLAPPPPVAPASKPAPLPPVGDAPRFLPVTNPSVAPVSVARPPVGVPTMVPLPLPVAVVPTVTPPEPDPEPARPPAVLSVARPVASFTAPAPLPGVVADDVKWQTTPDQTEQLPPGTWVPATGKPRPGVRPAADGSWQPGATDTTRPLPIARGQVGDSSPQADPVATLIRAVCRGRASEVDVRWTGSKKLMVCFEVRTPPDAVAVVREVSARPELAAYQIDFCVLVK